MGIEQIKIHNNSYTLFNSLFFLHTLTERKKIRLLEVLYLCVVLFLIYFPLVCFNFSPDLLWLYRVSFKDDYNIICILEFLDEFLFQLFLE